MKLLMATFREKWETDILRYFFYIINTFIEKYGYTLVDLSDYSNGSYMLDIYTKYHDIEHILVIENHDQTLINHIFLDFFNNKMITKYLLADDIHKYTDIKKDNYYDNFDYIFCTYKAPYFNIYPNNDKNKIVWCPHGYTKDYILNYNNNPKNKILLSGAIGGAYPLRKYIFNLYEKGGYSEKVSYLRHPGYKKFDYSQKDFKIGKLYAKILNEHICCFVDCLVYGFIVSKYFEIPATGSLLLAQNPDGDKLESLGFIDEVNYISCTKDNLKEKIEWILNPENKDKVDKIRENGMNMVRKNHSVDMRASFIYEFIKNNNKIR